jgi:hypothetical protein
MRDVISAAAGETAALREAAARAAGETEDIK